VTISQTTGQNPSSTRQGPSPETYYGAGAPDEISLVDLAKVLWNRRWWMVSIALATVVLALLFALSKEHEYRYTTTLRIGEVNIDKRVSNVEEVRETLERQLLPSLRSSFTDRHGLHRLPFDLTIEAGQAGGLVALVSESVVENEGLVSAFHSELASMLVVRHSEILDVISRQTERRLEHLYARLEFHQQRLDELNLLANAVAALGLAESEALESGQHPGPEGQSDLGDVGGLVISSGRDPTMTALMSRLQVSDLMNQYERSLSALIRDIEDNELQRDWITSTYVVVKALRSESPVGTGRSLILALGLVLGAMLGLFGAFLAEFGAQVRETLKAPADA
jgi:LPS O-antigen subunit length determinant protein (WzzB/FepE family)